MMFESDPRIIEYFFISDWCETCMIPRQVNVSYSMVRFVPHPTNSLNLSATFDLCHSEIL